MSDYVSQTIDVYNTIADSFAKQALNYCPKAQLEYFCSLVKKGGRVLDIGCGSGRDCASFVQKGFETVGVDLSEKLLGIAKATVPVATFLKQDIRKLSFSENYFDGLWSCASLLHIAHADIPQTLRSWFTVCKHNGALLIYVKKGIGEEEREEPSVIGVKRFYSLFTKELLMQYCQKAGFIILECFDVQKDSNLYNGKESLPWICCIAKKI
ncbi:MAG: methyltransferase type 11 [uncultured bacterium]|nr:MAG: methyltransferase type 11 [uncultured bacterium]